MPEEEKKGSGGGIPDSIVKPQKRRFGWFGREVRIEKTRSYEIHPLGALILDWWKFYGKTVLILVGVIIAGVAIYVEIPVLFMIFVLTNLVAIVVSNYLVNQFMQSQYKFILTTMFNNVHIGTGRWFEDEDGIQKQDIVVGKISEQHITMVLADQIDPESPYSLNIHGLTTINSAGGGKILNASFRDKATNTYIGKEGLDENITYMPLMAEFSREVTKERKKIEKMLRKSQISVRDYDEAVKMLSAAEEIWTTYYNHMTRLGLEVISFEGLLKKDQHIVVGISYQAEQGYKLWKRAMETEPAEWEPRIVQAVDMRGQLRMMAQTMNQEFNRMFLKTGAEIAQEEAYLHNATRASRSEKVLLTQEEMKRKPKTIDTMSVEERVVGSEEDQDDVEY